MYPFRAPVPGLKVLLRMTMSLTLDVFEIARTRQTVEGTLELDEMPELAHFIQALEGSLKFSVTGLGIVERLPAASLSFEGT